MSSVKLLVSHTLTVSIEKIVNYMKKIINYIRPVIFLAISVTILHKAQLINLNWQ